MSKAPSIQELKIQIKVLQEHHKRLLEKNQNDLKWIKQRQSIIKTQLQKIQAQRTEWKDQKIKLEAENLLLKEELLKKTHQNYKNKITQDDNKETDFVKNRIQNSKNKEQKICDNMDKLDTKIESPIDNLNQKQKQRNQNRSDNPQEQYLKLQFQNLRLKQQIDKFRLIVSQNLQKSLKQRLVQQQFTKKQLDGQQQIKRLKQDCERYIKQIDSKNNQLEVFELKIKHLGGESEHLTSKNQILLKQIQSLKVHYFELHQQLQKTKMKVSYQQKQIIDTEETNLKIHELTVKTTELQQQNILLKEMIQSMKTIIRAKEMEIHDHQEHLKEIKEKQVPISSSNHKNKKSQ